VIEVVTLSGLDCYQCVVCGTKLAHATTRVSCDVCHSEFPSIQGVSIRVAHAVAKLRATAMAQLQHAQNLGQALEQWKKLRSSSKDPARQRQAARAIEAHNALLTLTNDLGFMLEKSLVGMPQAWLDDVLSLDGSNAWDIDHMLPYFYQDWHRTGDFPAMCNRIRTAIDKGASPETRVLVIGAGACGLVGELATSGFEVHALDLSIPCLALANRLLRGESIEVTVPHKFEREWRAATLPGAPSPTKAPLVSVANAARLPLQSGTFPIIVSQYVIDIATNPTQIIAEIERVLEPGGLWVNAGLPFGLTNEPLEVSPLCDEALEPVLRDMGFELISLERHAHRLSDTGSLFDWPEVTTQWAQFSIARRKGDGREPNPDVFQQFRAGTSDAVWRYAPRRLPGRLLRGGPGSAHVSEASAAVVRWIGSHADGRMPLSTIRAQMPDIGQTLTDIQFIEVVRHLCDEGMLALDLPARS
jgi:SAM-dependent methyltransferase